MGEDINPRAPAQRRGAIRDASPARLLKFYSRAPSIKNTRTTSSPYPDTAFHTPWCRPRHGKYIRPLRREAGSWRATWLATPALVAPTSPSLRLTIRQATSSRLIGRSGASTLLAPAAGPRLCPPPSADRPHNPAQPPNRRSPMSNFSSSARGAVRPPTHSSTTSPAGGRSLDPGQCLDDLGVGEAGRHRLGFAARVAKRVRETGWHPQSSLQELGDGRVDQRLRVPSTTEIKHWVLG